MKKRHSFIEIWALISVFLVFAVIIFMFSYVFIKGAGSLSWEFLTQKPKGTVLGTEGGILPAIAGSLLFTAVALLAASVLGIGTAIYHVFYCKSKKISFIISIVMQCMSGIPSIVTGLFGYAFFVLYLGFGKCILAGGLTQAVMILPFIELRAERSLREADRSLVTGSYALGVTKSYTVFKLVIPQQLPGLCSGVLLAGLYAIGAAAPLIFTGAVIISNVPSGLMEPSMALPYHLYMLFTQGTCPENAWATALVLMVLVLLISFIAAYITRRKNKSWMKS